MEWHSFPVRLERLREHDERKPWLAFIPLILQPGKRPTVAAKVALRRYKEKWKRTWYGYALQRPFGETLEAVFTLLLPDGTPMRAFNIHFLVFEVSSPDAQAEPRSKPYLLAVPMIAGKGDGKEAEAATKTLLGLWRDMMKRGDSDLRWHTLYERKHFEAMLTGLEALGQTTKDRQLKVRVEEKTAFIKQLLDYWEREEHGVIARKVGKTEQQLLAELREIVLLIGEESIAA